MTVNELRKILETLPGEMNVMIDTARDERAAKVIERCANTLIIGVVNSESGWIECLYDETDEVRYRGERPVTSSVPV